MEEKQFKLRSDQIEDLVSGLGACMATDRILVDGQPVGYMYRNTPSGDTEYHDSGWVFMAGDESQEYADNPQNWALYDVNTVCNYDPDIIPLLGAPFGSAFGRHPVTGHFQAEKYEEPED